MVAALGCTVMVTRSKGLGSREAALPLPFFFRLRFMEPLFPASNRLSRWVTELEGLAMEEA